MNFEDAENEEIEKVSDIQDLDDIFEEAIENYSAAKDAWKDIFEESIDDREFALYGQQWDAKIELNRRRENRTVAVFNKCVQNIRYVVNSSLRDSPSIKVSPKDISKKESTEVIADIVRLIENESNAKETYSSCFQDAVAGGYGCYEVCTDPEHEDYKIKIKRVLEPTTIYPDHFAIEPDFSDMEWLVREKVISKKEFERKYPNINYENVNENTRTMWVEGSVVILEYWKKFKNGKVEWYILNGNEIIDTSEIHGSYVGSYIPYIFIIGEDISVNGDRHFKSIIRDIKDYQKTLNYMESEAIDYVAKNSKAPYIASDKSIERYMDQWMDSNTKNYPVLIYEEGKTPPQRVEPPKAPIGYIDAIQRLDTDIRTTIGIRDPLQDIPASQSGKAIKLQLAQSNLGTYVWVDHLNRSIKHCGRILVDLIPHFYNYPHTQMTQGVDGQITQKDIMIPDSNGKVLDLSGKYSVTISTGSSYEDQRSETRDMLLEMSKANPMLSQLGSDILVRTMDFKESDELADRLYTMLPPQIQALKKDGEQDPDIVMGQMKIKLEQMAEVLKQTTENLQNVMSENQKLQEQYQNKTQSEMLKIQAQNEGDIQKENLNNNSDEKIAMIKAESDYRIKEMELQYALRMKEIEAEIEKTKAISQFQNQVSQTVSEIVY